MIMLSRRSSRSATAPASGPSRSAGSSEVSQTPPTAALCAATPRPARSEARVDSTLAPAGLVGGDRKLTALGYPSQAPSAAFISVFVLRHGHIFPGVPPGSPCPPGQPLLLWITNGSSDPCPCRGSDPNHYWISTGGGRLGQG